jgi:chromosome segregation ATPase
MADFKFHCPECRQKIAVDEAAAGLRIDCPRCRSTLVIPAGATAPVTVEVRRRLAAMAGADTDVYAALEQAHTKLNATQEEVARLRATARDAEEEVRRSREEVSAATREAESVKTERDDLAGRLAETQAQLQAHAAERKEAESSTAQLAKLHDQLETLTAERDSLRINGQHASREAEALRSALTKLEMAGARQVEQNGALVEAEVQRRTETVSAQLAEMRSWATGLSREVADLQRQLESANADRAAARAELATRGGSLDEVASSAAAARAQAEELQARLNAALADVSRGEHEAAQAREASSRLEAALRERETAIAETNRALEATRAELARDRERLAGIEGDLRDTHEKLSRAGESEQSLRELAEEARKAVEDRDARIAALNTHRDRLDAELARNATATGAMARELETARAERDALKATLAGFEVELERDLKHLHAVEAERDALRDELDELKAGLERAKQHVAVLQSRRDQMRHEISRLKGALGSAPDAAG